MAKCKNCGAEIPEGNEYCDSCEKEQARDKEAKFYSDDLLNSIMTDNTSEKNDEAANEKNYFSELENLTDFPKMLQVDTAPNEQNAELDMAFPELMEEYAPQTNEMEDIFAGFEENAEHISEIREPEDIFAGLGEELPKIDEAEDMFASSENEVNAGFSEPELNGIENLFETDRKEDAQADDNLLFETKEEVPEMSEMKDLFDDMENTPNVTEKKDAEKKQSSSGFDDLFELGAIDNLDQLDAMEALFDDEGSNFAGMENLFGAETEEKNVSTDDVLPNFAGMEDLFAEKPESVPVDMSGMEDLFATNQEPEPALDGIFSMPVAASPSAEKSNSADKDMFSLDSLLGATEELPDDFFEEMEQSVAEEPEKEKKTKKAKKQKVKEERSKEEKPKKESKLYNKLFKNVPLDPSKIKEDPTPEEIAAKKKESADKKAKEKEEKKALAEAKKAEDQRKKEEKKHLAADRKEAKKAKKLEEAKLVLEEMKTTRINKAGASIVFGFFVIVAVVIIIGTNLASHSISIQHAEKEFERKRYNAAYEEVYGMKVKPDEQLLYDKIMTVMYVQKQLNSYNNFMVMEDNAKALDSLVKGLQRYEKYMYLADELGITADFDYVRGQLLDEIHRNFGLEEAETDRLVTLYNEGQKIGSQLDYSVAIYDAINSEVNE